MKRRALLRARSVWTTENLRTTRARAAIRTKSWSWRLCATAGKQTPHDPRARGRRDSRQGTEDRVPFAGIAGYNSRLRADCDCPVQLYIQSDFVGIAPLRARPFMARVLICRLADVAVVVSAGADQRHTGRAAPRPDRSLQYSRGENGRQFSIPASRRSDLAA